MTTRIKRLAALFIAAAFLLPGIAAAQSVYTHSHHRVPEDQVDAAADWYNRVLGGEPGRIGPGPGIRHHNGFVGAMPNEGMAGDSAGSVLDHIGISVPDVRAAVELIRAIGGEIRTEPQEGVTASLIAHVTDPWGGRFELLEDPVYTGVNHVHLFSADADALKDWFLEVFGGEYDEARGRGRFHTILYGDVWVHVTQAADDDPRGGSRYTAVDHIGFRVPSLDDFRAKLRASGYEPYLERPNPPGADLMFLEGPEGLHIEMTEPAPR
ncbi:MAG TPA: VOC family protein [Gammaproteobacteria bacterium]